VVLHADDLGLSPAVTAGILRGFHHGLLTSTSVLANAPEALAALDAWRGLEQRRAAGELPSADTRRRLGDPPREFDLGIHLNLTQGRPLTGSAYPQELLEPDGRFPGPGRLLWQLLRHRRKVQDRVRAELGRQIELVLDHGLTPTHLNGHQYVEMMPGVDALIPGLLSQYRIGVVRVAHERRLWRSAVGSGGSLRLCLSGQIKRAFALRFARRMRASGVACPAAYFGTAHAGWIDMARVRVFLQGLRPGETVEIGLHPAEAVQASPPVANDGWQDPLAARRPGELELLVSDALRQYFSDQGYRLGRLADLVAG
jgi:predicted glycoside hydrolase/deacetylase ChbG (UPF0249 family)